MENLWMDGANPVENPTRKKKFGRDARETRGWSRVHESSRFASLDRREQLRRISSRFTFPGHQTYVTVHRFHQTIGGRAYHIEVTPVSNRWRAQLSRTPGLPTAMMPFYGTTPDEAAGLLTKWLALAHSRQHACSAASLADESNQN